MENRHSGAEEKAVLQQETQTEEAQRQEGKGQEEQRQGASRQKDPGRLAPQQEQGMSEMAEVPKETLLEKGSPSQASREQNTEGEAARIKPGQGEQQREGLANKESRQPAHGGNLESYIEEMTRAAEPTFWGYLGCKLESASEEEVVVTLDAEPHHMNMMGIVHGGVLSSLMDNAMGIAVMLQRPGESTVTSNLNVHFVMPARGGRLYVTAHIVHQTHRSVTTESRITNERGELVALSTGSFRVR